MASWAALGPCSWGCDVFTFSELVILEVNPFPLFGPIGDVNTWFRDRAISLEARGKREAPNGANSGRINKSNYNKDEPVGSLIASVSAESSRVGPLQMELILRADASYAVYVIKGTSTIRAKSARVPRGETRVLPNGRIAKGGTFAPGERGIYLPPNLGYKGGVKVQSVSGQRANDFLSRAMSIESATHPALFGYRLG